MLFASPLFLLFSVIMNIGCRNGAARHYFDAKSLIWNHHYHQGLNSEPRSFRIASVKKKSE